MAGNAGISVTVLTLFYCLNQGQNIFIGEHTRM